MHRRIVCVVVALVASSFAIGTSPASAGSQRPFRILITNDDGVGAHGIDEVVEALRALPNVKVTVVAPAENASGSGSKTTPGELVTTKTETASGYPAIAVTGFPADTIVYAIDQGGVKQRPDLVVSGINEGQNLGILADEVSGTVGAAKAAAARGIPALAASQGLLEGGEPDYAAGVKQVVKWVKQHRKALTPKKGEEVDVILDNLNTPTCASGLKNRGLVDVPLAGQDVEGAIAPQDCASTLADPTSDIVAFNNGFVTLTEMPVPTT